VKGKWANVSCRKRNLVICQKTPTWSLEDAVDAIIKSRRQVDSISAELAAARNEIAAINSRVVPIGSIYIEYHNQPAPRSFWPTLTWQDISGTYAGLFFRTAGGDAAGWGTAGSNRLE